jgi:hypothetical protein
MGKDFGCSIAIAKRCCKQFAINGQQVDLVQARLVLSLVEVCPHHKIFIINIIISETAVKSPSSSCTSFHPGYPDSDKIDKGF